MSTADSGVSDERAAVEVRLERRRPSSESVRRAGEAEDLIAARVGEDRRVPADERVQAAGARDQLVAGPHVQVIGVGEHDLARRARRS